MRLEQKVSQKFIQDQKTLAIAESCTGGLISNLLTNIPGASTFYMFGIIAYANTAKTNILKVPSALIKEYGAVSEPVASAMAQGARKILKTDYGLGITGIAGPDGGTQQKPVGLVFIAVSRGPKTIVKKFLFKGNRISIKKQAAQTALKILAM
jgi:nicotinamide-nucleotide amidase